jgi:hypothetical protein
VRLKRRSFHSRESIGSRIKKEHGIHSFYGTCWNEEESLLERSIHAPYYVFAKDLCPLGTSSKGSRLVFIFNAYWVRRASLDDSTPPNNRRTAQDPRVTLRDRVSTVQRYATDIQDTQSDRSIVPLHWLERDCCWSVPYYHKVTLVAYSNPNDCQSLCSQSLAACRRSRSFSMKRSM